MIAPAKRGPIRRRKVSVELYFVLYLSAIILLLGTTPLSKKGTDAELEEAIVQLSLRDFKVRAKRAALVYPFIPAGATVDTAGLRLRRDSINLILASGTFADVRFAIVAIRDSASGETLPVECASLAQQGNASAEFRWRPCAPHRPGVYLVTVAGMATPLPPESVQPPELRQRVIDILRRRGPISDSATFAVTMMELNNGIVATLRQNPIDTSAGGTLDTLSLTDPSLLAAIQPTATGAGPAIGGELQVQSPTVIAAPGSTWKNQVFFTGFTNSPDITFTISPSNVSLVRNPNGLTLSGIAPASGKQQVTLRGVRASDRQTFNATFTVDASPLDGPDLPRQMYVGENYVVEFGSQGVPSEIVQVAAVIGSDTVASGGARINVTPSRTGTITFVRFVNRKRYDSYSATIIPLPAPTFSGQPDCSGSDFITVRTTSYGSVRGIPNKGQLVVDEGNVEDPIQDDYQYNSRTKAHQQTWKLRRKGKGETQVTLHILDQRGSRDPNGRSRNVEFNCQ
ncbi:MAG: hypothetical protein IT211_11820 [Armatimonadetes bacterium]|nr:hypothetical protein [Armatimonadota bacterium]